MKSMCKSELEPLTQGEDNKNIKLPKTLSLWDAAANIICTIIGSGIFIASKGVLQEANSTGMALIIWAAAGVVNIVAALIYLELSLTFPFVGSDYTYMRKGFGDFVGFLYIWIVFVFKDGCSRGVIALTFATYFSKMLLPGCEQPPEELLRLIAALALTTLTAAQCYSAKIAVKCSDFFTIAQLSGLAFILVASFVYLYYDNVKGALNMFETVNSSYEGCYALAFLSAYWPYSGISGSMNLVEEIKEPLKKNMLMAIAISLLTITSVYILTNFAYIVVLNPSEILASDAVALTFTQKILSGSFFWLMPFIVTCSTFGAMNGIILSSSRLAIAATRERHLPKPLALLSEKYLTPMPIYGVNLIISLILLTTSQIYNLILYSSYISLLAMTGSVMSLIYLRKTDDKLYRPFKLPLIVPILFCVVLATLLILATYERPMKLVACLTCLLSGVPVYLIFIYHEEKHEYFLEAEQTMTHLLQKMFMVLEEDNGKLKEDTKMKHDMKISLIKGFLVKKQGNCRNAATFYTSEQSDNDITCK